MLTIDEIAHLRICINTCLGAYLVHATDVKIRAPCCPVFRHRLQHHPLLGVLHCVSVFVRIYSGLFITKICISNVFSSF